MKKIFSIVLIIAMFMAINVSILPNTVEAVNGTDATVANYTPAKGLDEEDAPTTNTSTQLPKSGLENMSIIAIITIAMIGLGSFIRAKTIKIK